MCWLGVSKDFWGSYSTMTIVRELQGNAHSPSDMSRIGILKLFEDELKLDVEAEGFACRDRA